MAKFRITAPRNLGEIKKGTSFVVVSQSHCEHEHIAEVLYINGYKKTGGETAQSYCSAGNWDCEKISDEVFPALTEQHDRFLEEVYRDARLNPDKDIKLHGQIYYSPSISGPVTDRIKREDEKEACEARSKSKKEGGGSSGCCSICKCIWKILKCFC